MCVHICVCLCVSVYLTACLSVWRTVMVQAWMDQHIGMCVILELDGLEHSSHKAERKTFILLACLLPTSKRKIKWGERVHLFL